MRALLGSVGRWPLWPDVEQALAGLREVARVGVLSNVDDDLYAATRAAPLLDPALAMTSQRLRAYKPSPRLYQAARGELGPFVHVASSARDVRGSLEAGISAVRLVRPWPPARPGRTGARARRRRHWPSCRTSWGASRCVTTPG